MPRCAEDRVAARWKQHLQENVPASTFEHQTGPKGQHPQLLGLRNTEESVPCRPNQLATLLLAQFVRIVLILQTRRCLQKASLFRPPAAVPPCCKKAWETA